MKNEKTKNIVVGYGRKSKEDKDAKAVSLDNQEARCAEYAKARGCEFVWFGDMNKHGDNLNRKGYKDMFAFIKANKSKVACIVVWQLDRISRSMKDFLDR